MYEIDGSIGGGSVLRVAVPLALAQQEKITISNIRKSRSKPGLRPQHLKGIELLCHLTGSQLDGGTVGSTMIKITPGEEKLSSAEINISTAGSLSLVYQLLSNYCVMAGTSVEITCHGGGTHTKWSPNFDYLSKVTLPSMELFGQTASLEVDRVGYYPKGGAQATITIRQNRLPGLIELDVFEGSEEVHAISRASNHLKKSRVAERQIQGLLNQGIVLDGKTTTYDTASSPGSALTCWMVENNRCYRGFSHLGEKGVAAEVIGRKVADQIINFDEPAAVDEYLADQLMLALSQAEPGSFYTIPKVTKHVTTNLELINSMIPDALSIQDHNEYQTIQKI